MGTEMRLVPRLGRSLCGTPLAFRLDLLKGQGYASLAVQNKTCRQSLSVPNAPVGKPEAFRKESGRAELSLGAYLVGCG